METRDKKCSGCKQIKAVSMFPRARNNKRDSRCKRCMADRTRAWYYKNREAVLVRRREKWLENLAENQAKAAAYRPRYKERAKEYGKRYYLRVRHIRLEKNRATHLKRAYGLTTEDYDRMFNEQSGLCAICSKPERAGHTRGKDARSRLAVDHDHVTGTVRGLLCLRCNHALERLETEPMWHQSALDYLARHAATKRSAA